jgi:hypothetical protein
MIKFGLLLLGCTGLLSAGTIDVDSIQPATGAGYQQDQYGSYIGPYQLNTSIGDLLVMCMNLQYGVNPPYTANLTPVSNIPESPLTTYASDRTTYEEETYLFTLIMNAPDVTTQGEIQDAAWAVTDIAFYNTLVSTDNARSQASLDIYSNVVNMASNGSLATALNYSLYDVISNTAGVGSDTQEFIYLDPTSTPEPASVGVTGVVLLGFALLLKRISRRNRQSKATCLGE